MSEIPEGKIEPSEPIEVEVERLPLEGESAAQARAEAKRAELGNFLGPVMAGLAIDLIDLITPSPILGFALGCPLGIYIAKQAGAEPKMALQLGFLAGVYCAIPLTAGLPIGTLIGGAVKMRRALV